MRDSRVLRDEPRDGRRDKHDHRSERVGAGGAVELRERTVIDDRCGNEIPRETGEQIRARVLDRDPRQRDEQPHAKPLAGTQPSHDEREQRDLCDEIVSELEAHTSLEEECFYPFVREATDRLDLIEEATIEHDTAKQLMHELGDKKVEPARFHALVSILSEYVTLHVREEEERIFPIVEKLGVDLEALGEELAERKGMPTAGTGKAGRGSRNGGRGSGNGRGKDETHAGARNANERGRDEQHASRSTSRGQAAPEETTEEDGDQRASAQDSSEDDEQFLREHGDELSRSTQHAKWIHSVDDHEDHAGQTLATRNPDVIRQWAEERNATPATTPGGDPERPRVLRFDFPDFDRSLQEVSWDAWLRVFEERDLVFLFQERMKAGNQSNFFRLDSPQREDG
jgi:hemerythrin superfamily protein